MGRNRETKRDERLPTYVYRKPKLNAIEYRPYLSKGKFGASIYLKDEQGKQLPANAALNEVIKSYHRALSTDHNYGKALSWLFKKYFKSPKFMRLAVRTKKDYEFYAEKIEAMPGMNGSNFGEFPFDKITRKTIAAFRDKLSDKPTQANRRLQFLSAVFSWAIEEEHMNENPCKGVSKFSLQARDRYTEENEYNIVYQCAEEYPFLRVMIEIAYLCRARMSEIRKLPHDAPNDLGIFLKRSKKSESETTTWTPRLRAAVDAARDCSQNQSSKYLLHNSDGSMITENQFRNAWRRTMDKALQSGLKERFTFHDLKARGVTNHPTQHSGHKTERMKKIYVRKAPNVSATE